MPHSSMIYYGIHGITLKGTYDSKNKGLGERDRILKTMSLMEHLLRVNDQLDEQLHAGYYFYLLTSKGTFVSNSVFVYPIVIILLGYMIPNFIKYYEHKQVQSSSTELWAVSFIALAYAVGFLCMITPNLVLERFSKTSLADYCLDNRALNEYTAHLSMMTILVLSGLLLLAFKVIQPKSNDLWFLVKSHYWWPSLVFAGSLVVYQFSHCLIMCLFIFPLLQSASYLGRGIFSTVKTITLSSIVVAITVFILFGTYLAQKNIRSLPETLLKESILDYQCGGSNVWIYFCL